MQCFLVVSLFDLPAPLVSGGAFFLPYSNKEVPQGGRSDAYPKWGYGLRLWRLSLTQFSHSMFIGLRMVKMPQAFFMRTDHTISGFDTSF